MPNTIYSGKERNQAIKQVGFVLLLVGLFSLIVSQLSYFFSSVLGAFTLYMLLRKPHQKLLKKGWSKTVSTIFLLVVTILVVFVFGGFFGTTIFNKIKDFHPQIIIDNLNDLHDTILTRTGYNIFSKDIIDKAVQSVSDLIPNIFSLTGSIVSNALMMVLVLFFMLQQSREMELDIEQNLPLSANSISLLKKETKNMVVSNALGIPLIMIGQGVVSALGYWILGIGDPIIWGTLTGVVGLIPVVGTAGIWLPLSINLLINGEIWQGFVSIAYGVLVISNVDNLLRMVFLKKYANVHPLITIFGIILGMNLFGFWGIIFGPLMISGLILLCKIYKSEFLTD